VRVDGFAHEPIFRDVRSAVEEKVEDFSAPVTLPTCLPLSDLRRAQWHGVLFSRAR
jgi:hypothetical protein